MVSYLFALKIVNDCQISSEMIKSFMMDKYYFIMTYGCQMNIHESEKLAGILEETGYLPAQSVADADIIVLNTCCIRETAEGGLAITPTGLKAKRRLF